jgi:CBS domain-containing protein
MLSPKVALRSLVVPIDQCLTVSMGQIDRGRLQELRQRRFDEAPVTDSDRIVGIVHTGDVAVLADAGLPLTLDRVRPAEGGSVLYCTPRLGAPVDEVLERLSKNRSVLVASEGVGSAPRIVGFLTCSDLNKHHFRHVMYSPLAKLEEVLASMIEETCPVKGDEWPWLAHLDEDAQARLLGGWELARRKGVDLSPTAGATLTQLLQVVVKVEGLRNRLNVSYGSAREIARGISVLRNGVMHPVRPMVAGPWDVQRVRRALLAALEWTDRAVTGDPTPDCQPAHSQPQSNAQTGPDRDRRTKNAKSRNCPTRG